MEEIIIGTLLGTGEGLEYVDLSPEDFSPPFNHIMAAIEELSSRNQPYDLVSVLSYLEERNKLAEAGGRRRLTEIAMQATIPSLLPHYVARFKERLRRDLVREALVQAHEALVQGKSLEEVMESLETVLVDSGPQLDVLDGQGALKAWQEGQHAQSVALPPLKALAKHHLAFAPGEYLIIGGRPSVGKTALLTTMASAWAVDSGIPTLVVSLETPVGNMMERLLACRTGIPIWELRSGSLSPSQEAVLEKEKERVAKSPLLFLVHCDVSPRALRKVVRRARPRPKILIVDYIQLVSSGRSSASRYEEVTAVSRALKTLAMNEEVFLVCAAQLSRHVERRKEEPELADLRDSSALEADGDYVWILYRHSSDPRVINIKIAKNRNGPTGVEVLYFEMERSRFRDLSPSEAGAFRAEKEEEEVPF